MKYRLDELGWLQFEILVLALLKASLGLGIESWSGSGDLGRDCYSNSSLRFPSTELSEGPFLFQAKFVSGANASGAKFQSALMGAVSGEVNRIAVRLEQGIWVHPAHYVLVTNCPVTTKLRASVETQLAKVTSAKVSVLGATDIEGMLANHPDLRLSFPQLLGLSDLSALIAEQVGKELSERSAAAVAMALGLEAVFVPTSAFDRAQSILAKHHFAVLEGPPEVGKTAIARVIGILRLLDGWEVYECKRPADFFLAYQGGRKQFFIADDAFGRTEYDPTLGKDWERELEKILFRLDSDHQLCWTSRKHILERALKKIDLQGKALSFPNPSAVMVDAAKLNLQEKTLMLLRHSQAGKLSIDKIEIVKKFGKSIVQNGDFTPERIRRFVSDVLPTLCLDAQPASELAKSVDQSISDPTASMRKSFEGLSEAHKLILYLMIERDWWDALDDLGKSFEKAAPIFSVNESFQDASDEITGSFVRRMGESDNYVDWIHPSVRDLVIDQLAENVLDRQRYLSRGGANCYSLALSELGGSEGERIRPLLRTEEDWGLLIELQKRIVHAGEVAELAAVVNAASAVDQASLSHCEKKHFDLLLRSLFLEIRKRAVVGSYVIQGDSFQALCKLSIKVFPPETLPSPLPLWKVAYEEAKVASQDSSDYECAMHATPLLELINQLMESEPRFLAALNYPHAIQEDINRIAERLEGYDFESSDDALTEQRDAIEAALACVNELEEKNVGGAEWGVVASALSDTLENCEDKIRESRDDDDDYSSEEPPSNAFNLAMVDRVLEDLS